ncbi:hypothetical protein [Spiroplasma chrysopicola]|uniref:Transmembrane protein n=1 Tax=Spiroplasma chrysopicola DF-1 TaxID=1276227 RepID=R4UJD2_9MOLU|nr:hypothetical protein [Spiroplasma chrysopicola]AGM25421.1 hypothetical protein SCHRY_v1c08460 [Spiroplasma chrysopicola DF-1]
MRNIVRNIVTLVFIIISYFAFSTWINWMMRQQGNTVIVQIMSPFQVVILGLIFAMIIPTFKSIFLASYSLMRKYQKNKNQFLLYKYDKLMLILRLMERNVNTNNVNGLKRNFLSYDVNDIIRPQFVESLVADLKTAVVRDYALPRYGKVVKEVIKCCEDFYQKERAVSTGSVKRELFFDIRQGYQLTSQGSNYNIHYFETLYSKTNNKQQLGWKIYSLYMIKFNYYFLFYGLGLAAVVGIISFPIIGQYSNFNLATWGVSLLVMVSSVGTIVSHGFRSLTLSKKFEVRKYLILPAVTYYFLILLIFLNIAGSIMLLPSITAIPPESTNIFESGALPFLFALANLVLTTALLIYILATLMDYLKGPGLVKEYLIEGIILPLVMFLTFTITRTSLIIYYDDPQGLNPFVNMIQTFLTAALFIYWVVNWIFSSMMSAVVNNNKYLKLHGVSQAPKKHQKINSKKIK